MLLFISVTSDLVFASNGPRFQPNHFQTQDTYDVRVWFLNYSAFHGFFGTCLHYDCGTMRGDVTVLISLIPSYGHG